MFVLKHSFVFVFAFCLLMVGTSHDAGAQTPLKTELVASGFNRPLYVTSPPKDFKRLFVVEQRGEIKIIKKGVILPAPFIDLTGKVSQSGNERGLLGMAFHPDYGNNGFFYVNYTKQNGGETVVERYKVSGANPDLGDPASGLIILGPISQPFSNHNGGNIQFGPDGKLYIGLGDGGSAGDPDCRAQRGNTLLGKMLRINDDGTVPADNPFVGNATVLDEIWALGLRNPWRYSFDRETGDLYIGEVGQNSLEEIDFQPASSTGGENYGWKVMEGTSCFSGVNCPAGTPPCNDPSLLLPILEYSHSLGRCSVTGGYVYRGCAVPDLQGSYFFADFCTAEIWTFEYDGQNLTNLQNRNSELNSTGAIDFITSFGEDSDGEIYVVDQGTAANTGEIFKIVPDVAPAFEDLGFGKDGTGGLVPVLDICGFLNTGDTALMRLRDAFPNSNSLLVASFTQGQLPIFGGFLIPGLPTNLLFFFPTDNEGKIILAIQGGGGPLDVYFQYIILDPGASAGKSFSNAIKAMFQP